jgi:putative hydrolase of HD superfamily
LIENLIELFFKAASMQRWNDLIRPIELTELDKQAHKMIMAYVIAKIEEDSRKNAVGESINWLDLIDGFLFEFLYRLVLTDIKPQVFHKIREEKGEELDHHVLNELKKDFNGLNKEFLAKFEKYLLNPQITLEKRIVRAAHYLATNWEFKIIYHSAPFIYGIEKTKENIENQIEDHYDLVGVQKILLGKKSFGFVDICGQLRFQKRWAQSPRIPQTSVLGHMLMVAIISYLSSMELDTKPCEKRLFNNFFGGLFHDLPEALTKDIISPVKRGADLEETIKKYEKERMKEEIHPLIPKAWYDELLYFTDDEFKNKILKDGESKIIEEIDRKWNKDEYSPIDGKLIDICDQLAAFIEADTSIKHGIKSEALVNGLKSSKDKFKTSEYAKYGKINFKNILTYFEENTF